MVSPTIVRKVNRDKVKKIVSKANRPETLTSSGLEQDASKYKDPWKPVDANFLNLVSKFGTIRQNFAMDVPVSSHKKVFTAQSSRSNLAQAGKENVEPPIMRSNQGRDLEVVHHHDVQNFKLNAPLSSSNKLVHVLSSRSTSLTQVDGESARAHLMRSKQAGLEAVQHRPNLNFEMNAPLSSHKKSVRVPNSMSSSVPQPDSQKARAHNMVRSKEAGSSISTQPSNELHDINIGAFSDPSHELQDTSHHTFSVPHVDNIGSSKKTQKKRGRTKGFKLAKALEPGQRFEVIFPAHVNRPVGKYSTMFTTEIGVLVRQIAPLQAVSWGAISREIKDSIMDRLRDKFVFSNDPLVIKSVMHTMARRYNTWRYNIHNEFLKYQTLAAAVSNPPPQMGLRLPDWLYLCNLFCSPKFKARSERNKKNKDKLRSAHLAGTKAYSKIRYDKRNSDTQKELGFTKLYEASHRRADGSWVNENAREFHESLKEHESNAELEGTSLTDEQLSVLAFGKKRGYLCGLGYGPEPTSSVTGKRTRSEIEREAYEAVKRAELAEKSALEARKETAILAEKLIKMEEEQANSSEKLREEMYLQFALFRQQVLGNSSGQVRGEDGGIRMI